MFLYPAQGTFNAYGEVTDCSCQDRCHAILILSPLWGVCLLGLSCIACVSCFYIDIQVTVVLHTKILLSGLRAEWAPALLPALCIRYCGLRRMDPEVTRYTSSTQKSYLYHSVY